MAKYRARRVRISEGTHINKQLMDMLTYETLREFVIKEKNSPKLMDLPDNFFPDARTYLDNKTMISEGKEDLWELDNSRRMLQDLLDSRESKLVNLALVYVRAGVTPGKVMPEEKEFFDSLVESINAYQDSRKEAVEGKKEAMGTVAILGDIPKFIGIDMNNYGPFKKGDVASVPKENSELLVSKGLAREIESK